jgi:hypothetical protein
LSISGEGEDAQGETHCVEGQEQTSKGSCFAQKLSTQFDSRGDIFNLYSCQEGVVGTELTGKKPMRTGLSLFPDNTTERRVTRKKRKHKRPILVAMRGGWLSYPETRESFVSRQNTQLIFSVAHRSAQFLFRRTS